MSQRPAAKREPLDGLQRSRYSKIKDINSGSYGFVQLCQDSRTNEQVAVKFIERGEKVYSFSRRRDRNLHSIVLSRHRWLQMCLRGTFRKLLTNLLHADHKVC